MFLSIVEARYFAAPSLTLRLRLRGLAQDKAQHKFIASWGWERHPEYPHQLVHFHNRALLVSSNGANGLECAGAALGRTLPG
jgi:hypothetical protein